MPVSDAVRTRIRTFRDPNTRSGKRTSRALRGLAIAAAVCAAVAGCANTPDDSASIIRTTTNIAGAGVVGLERDTSRACALPSAPDPVSGSTRSVTHASGVSRVPADPQRIVVLSTSALDAVCAVGLWERVVGATTVGGTRPQPPYLGTGVLEIPAVGPAGQPDLAAIRNLDPDLILGGIPTATAGYQALQDIAPTVLVGDPADWRDEFTAYAAGLNRSDAAEAALQAYRTEATDTGRSLAAHLTQASLVRFTADGSHALGNETFAAQVLADVGAYRPTAQRERSFELDESDLERAEGDLIYVMFAGADGREHGESVMRSDEWKELGAVTDNRVFAVDDALWHTTGLTAARAVLDDIRNTLNGYVNN